jgi:hypothetical protein
LNATGYPPTVNIAALRQGGVVARFKQFGEVILNLDQVVKVERQDDVVKVFLAGSVRVAPSSGSSAFNFVSGGGSDPAVEHVFREREATEAWAFFTSSMS